MFISNFNAANKLLARFMPPSRSLRKAYTLDTMTLLMTELGNPQEKYKIIHIAGTSGKSSTAYYVTAMLKQAGYKVGLTISPHIDEVNERVQVSLKPLSEKQFCQELGIFLDIIESIKIKPTYFELLVAFSYWYFARVKVDYAVIEVGLGGLLDGTNVVNRRDKVCVITDIGLDHTEVLGKTIAEITAQKAGIIRPYNTAIMYEQDEQVMQVVREVCEQQQAELHEVWNLSNKELPKNLVLFQRRNWYLALSVYNLLVQRDGLVELSEQQLRATSSILIPARMEIFSLKDKILIIDGAHNAQKIQALTNSIRHRYPHQKVVVLLSLVQSKNFRLKSSLRAITKLASYIIITSFSGQQDHIKTSVNPLKIADYCVELGFENIEIIQNPILAFDALLTKKEPIALVTGSFYLLNHIRPIIKKMERVA